jgi:hypothetical protein
MAACFEACFGRPPPWSCWYSCFGRPPTVAPTTTDLTGRFELSTFPASPAGLFVNDESTYDGRQMAAVIRSFLAAYLLPELITIIVESAASIRHAWQPTAGVSVDRNTIVCNDDKFYKMVSIDSIVNGPRRWRIQAEFQPNRKSVLLIGVTLDPASVDQAFMEKALAEQTETEDDVLVSTTTVLQPSRIRTNMACICRKSRNFTILDKRQSTKPKTMAALQIDATNTLLCIDAEGNDGEPIGRIILPLQTVPRGRVDVDFRLCVVVYGAVTATILPWTDE